MARQALLLATHVISRSCGTPVSQITGRSSCPLLSGTLHLTVPLLPPVELLGYFPIFGLTYLSVLFGSGVSPQTALRWPQPVFTGERAAAHQQLGEDPTLQGDHSA
ncbi:hypothetical protein NET03_08360 [Thermomicrobium sp. CFH 73360]|uniref:hypothetical protein n=1 Tax=Thermomicrobium sp. CFH 73360 TaxID=2951987 RepID=UPI00207735AE|nr:hypothetical protein [Thermomicrobium sp. CFH 73360]MCM8746547.1 hypothetical protein [Thermomicrobium sp. CFH 73360]